MIPVMKTYKNDYSNMVKYFLNELGIEISNAFIFV